MIDKLWQRFKLWIVAGFGAIVLLITVYLAGRRKQRGQVDAEVAQRETAHTQQQVKTLQKRVDDNAHKLTATDQEQSKEEAAQAQRTRQIDALSDSAVTARLRDLGLLK